jgi:prolyl 4-hydroxylase
VSFDVKEIQKMFLADLSSYESLATDFDLSGAVEGILRVQKFYKIKTSEIAAGVLNCRKVSEELSGEALNLIALKAHESGKEKFAQEFWNLSLAKTASAELKAEISINLAKSYKNDGKFNESLAILNEVLENDPSKISAFLLKMELENSGFFQNQTFNEESMENFHHDGKFDSRKEEILYRKACRGELRKSERELSRLRCLYYSTSLYSSIARFKVEELNLEPRIVLFIDILSDHEIDHLKQISSSELSRSMTFDSEILVTNDRVSQISWHSEEDEIVGRVNTRLEEMTGLSMKSAENLQMQNYGIGGQYSLHYDHRLESQSPFFLGTGNRIASVLFYVRNQ